MSTDVAVEAGVPRPLRADARRNFDALVASARTAFAEQGTSASLEDIARRAGVGIGTLYRHFPARDALVEAVYVEEVERMVRDVEQIASREPWQALDLWLRRFVAYVSAKRVLVEGLNRESPVLSTCRTIIYDSGRPILERAQQAGVARGDVEIEDAMRLVQGLAAVAFQPPWQAQTVAFGVMGLGFYMLHASIQIFVTELAPATRSSAIAFHTFSIFVGQGIGTIVFGLGLASLGATVTLLICAAMIALVGTVAALLLTRPKPT